MPDSNPPPWCPPCLLFSVYYSTGILQHGHIGLEKLSDKFKSFSFNLIFSAFRPKPSISYRTSQVFCTYCTCHTVPKSFWISLKLSEKRNLWRQMSCRVWKGRVHRNQGQKVVVPSLTPPRPCSICVLLMARSPGKKEGRGEQFSQTKIQYLFNII